MERIDRQALDSLLEKETVAASMSPAEREGLLHWVAQANAAQREPVMMKVLAGIGAWIASLFLLTSMLAGFLDDSGAGAAVFGGLLLVGSAALSRRHNSVFIDQASLAIALAGNGLILFGVGESMQGTSLGTLSVAQVIIAAISWEFVRYPAFRFIAAGSTFFLFTAFAFKEDSALLLYAVIAAELLCGALIAVSYLPQRFMPLVHAAVMTLAGTMIYIAFSERGGWFSNDMPLSNTPIFVMLLLAAAALIGWLTEKRQVTPMAAGFAFALVLLLCVVSTPGVVLAIMLLATAHACGDRVLGVAAGLFLPLFLFHYYYAMDVTLAFKSMALLSSGAVLLLALWASKLLGRSA